MGNSQTQGSSLGFQNPLKRQVGVVVCLDPSTQRLRRDVPGASWQEALVKSQEPGSSSRSRDFAPKYIRWGATKEDIQLHPLFPCLNVFIFEF